MVTNDTYINANSVCDLLRRIAASGLTLPITLILDNARYQKCGFLYAKVRKATWAFVAI